MDTTPTLLITDATDAQIINETASSSNSTVPSSAALLKTQKIRGQIQFTALCWSLFLLGWNDGSTGPLLLRIKEVYHVGSSWSLIMLFKSGINKIWQLFSFPLFLSNTGWIRDCITYFCILEYGEYALGFFFFFSFVNALGQYNKVFLWVGIYRRSCSQHVSNRYARFREGKWLRFGYEHPQHVNTNAVFIIYFRQLFWDRFYKWPHTQFNHPHPPSLSSWWRISSTD